LAFVEIARIHSLMSFHDEGSDLALLRRAACGLVVEIDASTVVVLREAKSLWEISGGAFDASMAPLLVRWGYLPRPPGIDLRRCRSQRMDALEFIDDRRVCLREPMLIDLGGIAKGYAIDRAVNVLKAMGAPCGIVNAGGDLRAFGELDAPVHLRAADRSGAEGGIILRNAALASSGNLDRRRRRAGAERAPHIDGAGNPILSEGLTVVEAPLAIHADALTKVAMADAALFARMAPQFGAVLHRTSPVRERARQ
jgi:thiamine biosynthesis lipoprotein